MNRRVIVAALAAAAAAGAVPTFAAPSAPAATKGTLSYTDLTPDLSPTVLSEANKRSGFCVGLMPAGPADVNSLPVKLAGPGLLTVKGANALDWAMEIRDSKNQLLAGSDGTTPTDKEGTSVKIKKAGTYNVIYCNLTGEPQVTATWAFKPSPK